MPKKPPKPADLSKRIEALEEFAEGELTERESRFVDEYVACGVGLKAVLAAGFTTNRNSAHVYANRLLSRPRVKAAVAAARAELSQKTGLTAEWIERGLMREAEEAETGAARIRARELLGKRLGMFVDRVEVIEKLDPEERKRRLAAIIAKGKERASK